MIAGPSAPGKGPGGNLGNLGRKRLHHRVVRRPCLHHRDTRFGAPARPSGDLTDQLEGALGGPQIAAA